MPQYCSRFFSIFLLITIAVPVQQTVAQGILEEIVVTAQRREQSLQDVPISITAYTAEILEQNRVRGARDYVLMTPNVAFAENDQQGTKNGDIAIRGLSDLTAGGNERIIQTRPAIGINVDEFSVSSVSSGSANPPLNDIERVEILRGPQGTYFGRNATGGAINIITKKPNENREGKISVGVGNFDTYSIGALANVPIADNLFLRGSVSFETSGGMIENLHPDGSDSDYDDINAKVALRWQPGNWTFDVAGQIIEEELGNIGKIPTGVGPAGFLFGGPGATGPDDLVATCGRGADLFFQNGNDDKNCEDQPTFQEIDNNIITLRAEYAGDRFTLTSITGRLDSEFRQLEDLDNSGYNMFDRLNEYDSESISQELRLSSAGDWQIGNMPFTWTVGGIVYDDEFEVFNTIITGTDVVPGFVGFLVTPGDHPNENQQFVNRDGWAAFFDFSLDIVDNLTVIFGGRYSEDDDEQYWRNTYATFDCGSRPLGGELREGCAPRADQYPLTVYANRDGALFVSGGRFAQTLFTDHSTSDSDFSPRAAINWRFTDDHSFYFTFSQGYRAAGVRVAADASGRSAQLAPESAPDTRSRFKQETVRNYEVGWKGYFNGRRTKIEAAVFRMDWDDMQVRLDRFQCQLPSGEFVDFTLDPRAVDCVTGPIPDSRVFNAQKARSQGIELTFQSLVGDYIEIGAYLGYLDAEFRDFKNSQYGDVSGEELPNSPEITAGGLAQVNWTMGNVDTFLRVEVNHRSDVYTQFNHIASDGFPYQADDFTVVNLRAGASWKNHQLNLSVGNLFEEDYTLGAEDFTLTGVVVQPHPRFIHATWSMDLDF